MPDKPLVLDAATALPKEGEWPSAGGVVLQHKTFFDSTDAFTATGYFPPADSTEPQRSELYDLNIEGTITPISGTSELWLHLCFVVGGSNTIAAPLIGAFRDGLDSALRIFTVGTLANINNVATIAGSVKIPNPGAGVTRTIELRLGMQGGNSGFSVHINRQAGNADFYGTSLGSVAWLEERTPAS